MKNTGSQWLLTVGEPVSSREELPYVLFKPRQRWTHVQSGKSLIDSVGSTRSCLSVRPSVRPSVPPSLHHHHQQRRKGHEFGRWGIGGEEEMMLMQNSYEVLKNIKLNFKNKNEFFCLSYLYVSFI